MFFDFISGPLVWIAALVCLGGSIFKIVEMLKMAKQERVIYPYMNFRFSIRSLMHWIIPYGSRSMRINTLLTAVAFSFHICLLLTPFLLLAHQQLWGFQFLVLPSWLADFMTIVVIAGGLYFLQRRLTVPYVKNVTAPADYMLLLAVITPYVTGFLAYHHWFNYDVVITVHILSGCLMLFIIPFTRIAHMLYFVFTRAYMACEFGFVRDAKDW